MTAAALAKKCAPMLRTAEGEPPLGADGEAFRADQGEMFFHDIETYRTAATRVGILELNNGCWLAFPFGVDRLQYATRELALRAGIAQLIRKARRYMKNGEGEGTHWTEGFGGRVIEWALSLRPEKILNHLAGQIEAAPIGHPGTAQASETLDVLANLDSEITEAGVTDDSPGDLPGEVIQNTDTIVAALLADHRARKTYPAGHTFSMTNPVINGSMVTLGTCSCGDSFSYPYGSAGHERMDAAIEAHRQKFDSLPDKVDGRGNPIVQDEYLAGIQAKTSRKKKQPAAGGLPAATCPAKLKERSRIASAPSTDAPRGADAVNSEVSEPLMNEALSNAEADPVREAGFHGGSLALDDEDLCIDWPSYETFLEDKIVTAPIDGIEISGDDVSDLLKPHQRDLVVWAVRGGQRAIFAAFGLGKTFMQIEILRLITGRIKGNGLIVLPLGVRQEFFRDAEKLGVEFKFIRSNDDIEPGHRLYLTNYENVRDGRLDPAKFIVASLDESSVLRSYGSKTFQEFLPLFSKTRFRFVATATPSPNRYKEIIHYSAFLGVMDSGQALTRFFQRDSEKAGNLTLYPHKEREFWMWVHSWASFLQAPSNLGYSDQGYALPPLDVQYHEVPSNHALAGSERDGQALLFRNAAVGLQAAARERNDTLAARVQKLVEIVNDYRRTPTVSEGLLPGEPRSIAAETAQAQQRRLSEEQGILPSPREALEAGQSRTVPRIGPELSRQKLGKDEGDQPNLVSEQQGVGLTEAAAAEAEKGLRSDDGPIRSDGDRASRSLRDLQGRNDAAGIEAADGDRNRSQSPDRQGAGTSVPALQRGDGNVLRRSGAAHERSGLVDQIVIWCDLNAEQRSIEQALKAAGISFSSLYGDQDIEERERLLEQWRNRETSVFLSKPVMYGAGVNLQQCHTMIFVGISYKFQDLIQAIHRICRFLQEHACEVHIIHSEAEREILSALKQKWTHHEQLTATMAEIIKNHGLDALPMRDMLARSIGIKRVEIAGENFRAINNDCVAEARTWADNSVDQIITSIPFSNHYEYSPNYSDFGHTDDNGHFWGQMDFLTAELLRMLKPGRLACIHVKDRILFGAVTGEGVPTISPFHAEAIMHYRAHGFQYMGMITVVTDVVRENNQTYRLGWSECAKDGTKMGVGSPEYILLLRKPQSDRSRGYADVPVTKTKAESDLLGQGEGDFSRARWQIDAHAFWRSSGNRLLTPDEFAMMGPGDHARLFSVTSIDRIYDYEAHVRIGENLERHGTLPATFMAIAPGSHCSDVWHDVNRMRTLNMLQQRKGAEMHLCPLQFDIVDRLIERFSNEGELIFDPFGGLMTVPYRALLKNRKGAATELSSAYFLDGVHYLRMAEEKMTTPQLFDLAAFDQAATPPPSTR